MARTSEEVVTDEIDRDAVRSYAQHIARRLGRGNEEAQRAVVRFLEKQMRSKGLHSEDFLSIAPFEREVEGHLTTVKVEMTIRKSGRNFKVTHKTFTTIPSGADSVSPTTASVEPEIETAGSGEEPEVHTPIFRGEIEDHTAIPVDTGVVHPPSTNADRAPSPPNSNSYRAQHPPVKDADRAPHLLSTNADRPPRPPITGADRAPHPPSTSAARAPRPPITHADRAPHPLSASADRAPHPPITNADRAPHSLSTNAVRALHTPVSKPGAAAAHQPISCTDPFFGVLFFAGALLPQASLALYNLHRCIFAAQAAAFEMRSVMIQEVAIAMGMCALFGFILLQVVRCLPIKSLLVSIVICCTMLLFGLGIALQRSEVDVADGHILVRKFTGCALQGVAALGVLVTWYFWKEIQLSIAVLKSTSDFLRDVPSVPILYPPLFASMHVVGFLLWTQAVLGAIALLGEGQDEGPGMLFQHHFGAFRASALLILFYFWGNYFVTGLSCFATAAATASWYFAAQNQKGAVVGVRAAWKLVWTGLWYHGGSLALGSFLLAVLQMMNLALFWARRHHERREDDGWMWRCLVCVRESAARVLDMIARRACRQAYVEVAVSHCSFLEGAAAAAKRAAAAPKRVLAVETASFVFRCVVQLGLIVAVGFVAWLLYVPQLRMESAADERLDVEKGVAGNLLVVIGLPCFAAWLVAESILHPINVATSTILHCLLLDGGAVDRSHTPAALSKVLSVAQQDDLSFATHYS